MTGYRGGAPVLAPLIGLKRVSAPAASPLTRIYSQTGQGYVANKKGFCQPNQMPATIMLDGCSSLDKMIAMDRKVRVLCDGCKAVDQVDLVALRKRVGGDYSLINRQCKCRMTPGCEGWNRFYVLNGVYRPLWDGRWV